MQGYWKMVEAAAAFIRRRVKGTAEIGVLTGTGLGASTGSLSVEKTLAYADIPNFPESTVVSHAGRLLFGSMAGRSIMVFQGRFHLYEGYTPREVVFPIRVLQHLGVKYLIVTNAAGGLNLDFNPGDIMLIHDHINLTGANPLVGPNREKWGERFPDMTRVYDKTLVHTVELTCRNLKIDIRKGVYAGLLGPSLETPAEIRFLRAIGADAVGLSTVQEVIAAVHAGMKIAGLSIITNVSDPDDPVPASVASILEVANRAAPVVDQIISGLVGSIGVH
ncbi:MAG: purine-nucleoside phosphorylase [Deltaproteobacteria bacterium]|nr:purine-nucleoside phosphorylase [Deltaproteobacteria bacterium]